MNEWFGLGIALELRDRMSQGLETARNSFERFRSTTQQSVQDVEAQIDRLNSLQVTGALLSGTGSMLTGMGASMLNPIVDLGREVINTSSQFEQWRMTLKALYKDADVATEKLAWGMKLASTTPFEMTDVTQALIGFKAVGAEADTMFTNANGQARSFLEYMGDLAALRPDVGLEGVMLGVRNLLGGDGGKSLRMRMDIDFENILGRDFGSTTEEIMQDLVTVSDQLAGGLMTELEGTWSQLISNLKDQTTRLYLAIGDNGAFDMFKNSLRGFSDMINSIDDDRMTKIGTNIAEAFKMIWTPVQWVINGLQTVFKWILKLAESDSIFSKLVLGVTAFVGSILALTGVMLTLGGGFLQTISSLGIFLLMLQTSPLKFTGILNSMKLLASRILPLIALMGALAVAWKTDFMGIKTTMTNFTNTLRTSWREARRISQLGVTDMLAELDKLDTKTFGGWLTYNLTRLMVLWDAVCEAWNTNELSDETFQKVQALGLLPLLSAILDMKQRATSFFDGFKKGWQNVSKVVSAVVGWIGSLLGKLIAWLFPVKEGVEEVSEVVGGINISAWEKFGEITAYVVSVLGGIWAVAKVVGVVSTVVGWVVQLGSFIGGVISGISTLVGWIGTAISWIGGLVLAVLGFFGIAVTAPAWVVGAITLAIAAIIGLVVAFWDEIVAGFVWLKDEIVRLWGEFCNFISEKMTALSQWWSDLCNSFSTWWNDLCTSISNKWSEICNAITTWWSDLCNSVKTLWSDTVNTIKTFFNNIWEKASEIFSNVVNKWNEVTGIFSNIFSGIMDSARAMFDWLGEKFGWVADIISSITGAISNIGSGIKNFGGNIISGVKHMVGLNTGGYVKTEGVAMLHPNEVVVNDELTQKLRTFLDEGQSAPVISNNNARTLSSTSNDNSVTFNEGAIQINLQQGSEADATKLAKMIMEKIKRETQLRSTLNYNPY